VKVEKYFHPFSFTLSPFTFPDFNNGGCPKSQKINHKGHKEKTQRTQSVDNQQYFFVFFV